MNFYEIAQFGIAGLAVYLMYKIAVNHISHNTKAFEELRDVIRELVAFLKIKL